MKTCPQCSAVLVQGAQDNFIFENCSADWRHFSTAQKKKGETYLFGPQYHIAEQGSLLGGAA